MPPQDLSPIPLPNLENFFSVLESYLVRHHGTRKLGTRELKKRIYMYSSFFGLYKVKRLCLDKAVAAEIENLISGKSPQHLKHSIHYFKLLYDFLDTIAVLERKSEVQLKRIRYAVDIHHAAFTLSMYSGSATHWKELKASLLNFIRNLKSLGEKEDEALLFVLDVIKTIAEKNDMRKTNSNEFPIWGPYAVERLASDVTKLTKEEFAALYSEVKKIDMGQGYEGLLDSLYNAVNTVLKQRRLKKKSNSLVSLFNLLKAHRAAYKAYCLSKGGRIGLAIDEYIISIKAYKKINKETEITIACRELEKIGTNEEGYGWRTKVPRWILKRTNLYKKTRFRHRLRSSRPRTLTQAAAR